MVINVKAYTNFLSYLHSVPSESILFSSIRSNITPVFSFGGPAEESFTGYEFVLQHQGVSIYYQSKVKTDELLTEIDKIQEVAIAKGILTIPIEEGDTVSLT